MTVGTKMAWNKVADRWSLHAEHTPTRARDCLHFSCQREAKTNALWHHGGMRARRIMAAFYTCMSHTHQSQWPVFYICMSKRRNNTRIFGSGEAPRQESTHASTHACTTTQSASRARARTQCPRFSQRGETGAGTNADIGRGRRGVILRMQAPAAHPCKTIPRRESAIVSEWPSSSHIWNSTSIPSNRPPARCLFSQS